MHGAWCDVFEALALLQGTALLWWGSFTAGRWLRRRRLERILEGNRRKYGCDSPSSH